MRFLIIPGIPLVLISAGIDTGKSTAPAGLLAVLHGIGIAGPILLLILLLILFLRRHRCP
jgi:hypothetical protein